MEFGITKLLIVPDVVIVLFGIDLGARRNVVDG